MALQLPLGFAPTGSAPQFSYAGSYNINPSPQGGAGPYGAVPGPIGIPPSIYSQVQQQYPNLGNVNKQAFDFASGELAGQMSPETLSAIQNANAAWGVGAGMPNTGPGSITGNRELRNIGLNVEQVQHQGATDYASLLQSIGSTQTNPNLAAEIAASNAQLAAAPNPAQAAAALEAQFLQNLQKEYGLIQGGPSRGTGQYGYSPVRSAPNLSGGTAGYGAAGGAPATGALPAQSPQGMFYGGTWYPTGTKPTNSTQPGYQLNPMYNNPASPTTDYEQVLFDLLGPYGAQYGGEGSDAGGDYYGDY